MIWLLGVVVGIGVAFAAMRWALRSHREVRKPWLDLLSTSAVDGVADDGGGSIAPITAPFTGRPCLGFVLEIIVEEQHGNETTWYRAFTDGAGQLFLLGPDGRRTAWVDLRGARVVFPTPLDEYGKYSSSLTNETVFHGTIDRAPPQLVGFVQRLDPETQALVWRPSGQLIGGKRVYFNERIVLPGQRVVAAGQLERGEASVHVVPVDHAPVAVAHGTLDGERARVAKLPVAGELFGAIIAGGIACGLVEMIIAMVTK